MSMTKITKVGATAAMAVGIAAGSYGVASAASGSGGANAASSTPAATNAAPPSGAPGPGQPWGGQRSDETPLTGDALAKVKAVALDHAPGGTVERVETDADGNAKYEAHIVRADGTPATVYVDGSFAFVSIESR
jgi:hypothetical protein